MELVEIRDLDGPNVFLLEPAIKLEFKVTGADRADLAGLARRLGIDGPPLSLDSDLSAELAVGALIERAVLELHRRSDAPSPRSVVQSLETPGHAAVAFGWDHRRFALRVAEAIGEAIRGAQLDVANVAATLRGMRDEVASDDRPTMVRDADRRMRAIAVTGTNGKTTTTRLIAHTLRASGLHVGWCSSSGVYIDGREVVQGDYSGPGGARRVLGDPDIDVGILETARGGILLRGVAYESNDIGVFTNVSADHLDLQGVRTVERLARVKSVVVRVTRADGFAVLNADDPLVMRVSAGIRARRFLVSQQPERDAVDRHVRDGGAALVSGDGRLVYWRDGVASRLIDIADVPIAYGGKARHMTENALCAAAACLAFGLDEEAVRQGLSSFENTPELNIGRLNVVPIGGVTVIVDYAHNEAGLSHLLEFARLYLGDGGRLISIIGTAGDRTDHSLREIGRIAAIGSDAVIVKGTERYLRGRMLAELIDLYEQGIGLGGREAAAIETLELPALQRALDGAKSGDVIAMMAQEQIPEILRYLADLDSPASNREYPGSARHLPGASSTGSPRASV
jgi:cyanophycin synthetase